MSRIQQVLDAMSEVVVALLMAALALVVFLGVVYRYVLIAPLPWVEEVARLLIVWISFVGAYLAMRRGEHIAMDLISERLRGAPRQAVACIGMACQVGFLCVLLWYGSRYSWAFVGAASVYLGFPVGLTYFAMPIGAALLLLALLARIPSIVNAARLPQGEQGQQ